MPLTPATMIAEAVDSGRCLTPPQLARQWQVSPDKVIGFIRSGELRAFNVAAKPHGRPRWRISAADAVAFEQRRAAIPPLPTPRRRTRRRDENVIQFF